MPSTITKGLESLLAANMFRFAKCWKLTRTDGVILRFTDHIAPIVIGSDTYVPASFDSSAFESKTGFPQNNIELRGYLSSSAIAYEDLRAGLYRGATIEVFVVDWLYPWAGNFRTDTMTVESVKYTGEIWEAQVLGLTGLLRKKVGRTLNRDCDANVGDTRCGVAIESHRKTGTISTVSESRRVFTTTLVDADGLYDLGEITWTSGLNNGLQSEVKSYLNASGALTLQIRAPYAVAVSDTFSIIPGCAGIREHCKGTSGTGGKPWATNINRYRGFPDIPGTSAILQTPDTP